MATAAEQAFQSTVNRLADQAGALDPRLVQAALDEGGSLSGSLGFTDYNKDLFGMSPAEVQQVINNRGTIQQQNMGLLKQTAELNDMLTGGREARDRQFQMAQSMFTNASEADRQAARLSTEKELTHDRLAQEFAIHQANLNEQKRQHDMNYKIAQGHLGIAQQQLNLKKQEIAAVSAAARGALSGGMDPKSVKSFIDTFGGLANSAAKDGRWGDYHQYKLQEYAMTSPLGTILDSKDFEKHNGGWPQVQLGPDGNWYGIKRNLTGKPYKAPGRNTVAPGQIMEMSREPLVTNPLLSLKSYVSMSGQNRAPMFYHKYGAIPGEEE